MTNYQYEDKKTNNLVKQVVGTLSRRMGLSGQSESGIKMKTAEDLAWRESIRSIDLALSTRFLPRRGIHRGRADPRFVP